MTPDETVVLARYVKALCPQQKFDEFTPDAWHDVLSNYDLADARAASATVARAQPFVAPSEIVTEIVRARAERLDNFQYEGDPDETPREYLTRYRALLAATAAGHIPTPTHPPALTGGPHSTVTAALTGIGQTVPDEKPRPKPVFGPLGINCPKCGAPIGRPCTSSFRNRAMATPHPVRRRVAAGEPATTETPDEIERRRAQSAAALARMTGATHE